MLKAFQQFYKAEELIKSKGSNEPYEEAQIYLDLSECCFAMSNYKQSISYAQKALAVLKSLETEDHSRFAHYSIEALSYLGRAALINKNASLAESAFSEMYTIANYRRLPEHAPFFAEEPEKHAASFSYAGSYFMSRDRFDLAETFFHYAIQGWQLTGNPVNESITWNKLGLVFMRTSKYKDAVEAYKKAESILLSTGSPQTSKLGKILFNEADAQRAVGDLVAARDARKQARVYWFNSNR